MASPAAILIRFCSATPTLDIEWETLSEMSKTENQDRRSE